MLAAWWLHAAHPDTWPVPAVIAIVAAWVLVAVGHRLGLPTPGERLYAAAVALAIGGWLAAATILGPFTAPLPQVLIAGGLVLAVPWWAHRRRRARVRVERKLAAWPEIAQAVGLTGSQVMSAVVDLWGWRARFRLARGQTIEDVRAKLPAIESGLGTFRGAARVYPTPDDLANRFELRVLNKDPHADAITWPGPSTTTITEPIDLGPFEDATPARVLFLRRHALFGGATGSGKSGGLNVLLGNLVGLRRCRHLGHRPQAGHGTRPRGHRASAAWPPPPPKPARCSPVPWPCWKPAPPCSRRPASASGTPPRERPH